MQLSSLAALFLASVAFTPQALADLHASCTCTDNGTVSASLASSACSNYASQGYERSVVSFDSATGRCTAASGSQLMGDQWETACKAVSTTPDAVKGSC